MCHEVHPDYVFLFRGHRVENVNNTAWQLARKIAGISDLHIHDLRHTVGMRLREAGVREETKRLQTFCGMPDKL